MKKILEMILYLLPHLSSHVYWKCPEAIYNSTLHRCYNFRVPQHFVLMTIVIGYRYRFINKKLNLFK